MEGVHQILPGWVNPATTGQHIAVYELRLRRLARYVYALHNGGLTVNPTHPDPIDVHISAEPVTALLLNYGRTGSASRQHDRKAPGLGPRPWLALRLPGRMHPA